MRQMKFSVGLLPGNSCCDDFFFVMAADASAAAAPVVKRQNALSWDAFFMALAQLSAQRSKDPSTQVGACIVDADNRVISIGYNGCGFGSL